MTKRDPITTYREWMQVRRLSPPMISRRCATLRTAEAFTGKPILRLTADDVTALVRRGRNRGLADSTIYVYAGHLRAFFEWARRNGLTRQNPVDSAAVPRRPRYLPRPIADGPLQLAIDTATPRTRVMLLLAFLGGLRACEVARLRREDILDRMDPPQMLIHGKGDKPRAVPLSDALLMELDRYGLPKRGPVIRRHDGQPGPVSVSVVCKDTNEHLHSLGIPDTFHSLRHAAATALYRETKDIRLVGDVLGHSSPSVTAIYAAWAREDAPAAMQRLGDRLTPQPVA